MGKVTSLFARKVVEEVADGVDKDALLRSVGLERSGSVDPSYMIEDTDYYAFLERAAAADPQGTTLPLRAGAAMRCDDYGAFGLAWKSATTLRGSYDRAERYALVLTSVSTYEVEKTVDGAFMHLHREGERRLGLRLSNEATIASIASIRSLGLVDPPRSSGDIVEFFTRAAVPEPISSTRQPLAADESARFIKGTPLGRGVPLAPHENR